MSWSEYERCHYQPQLWLPPCGCSLVRKFASNEGSIVELLRSSGDPLKTFTQNEPLTDTELDRLGDFLKSCKGGRAMNVEALDGFFAALIAGPETVMPSEYYREVFGGEMADACEFGSLDEANEIWD